MDSSQQQKYLRREKRELRVRKFLRGSASKPRMCVVKTNKHLYVQLIDDTIGQVICSLSTHAKTMRSTPHCHKSKESGRVLGEQVAQMAQGKEIKKVVFDRGAHRYHGVLAAVADGARAAGLEF